MAHFSSSLFLSTTDSRINKPRRLKSVLPVKLKTTKGPYGQHKLEPAWLVYPVSGYRRSLEAFCQKRFELFPKKSRKPLVLTNLSDVRF